MPRELTGNLFKNKPEQQQQNAHTHTHTQNTQKVKNTGNELYNKVKQIYKLF